MFEVNMENTLKTQGSLAYSNEAMHQEWNTTAYWANFMAIVNYVLLSFSVLALFRVLSNRQLFYLPPSIVVVLVFLLLLGVAFILTTFLYRFARKMRQVFMFGEQEDFEVAWLNLRNYFRWTGIIMTVVLVGYLCLVLILAYRLVGL